MFPFAIPYPPEQTAGYWGVPTLTIDWCEENYVVSNYIAEAVNTITNAGFIAVACLAIYLARKNLLEDRFVYSALGFMLVGVGLWWFHMTLRYEYQLLDELPMIYATCIPFWSVFSEFKTPKQSAVVALAVMSAAATLTFVYLYIQDPTIHQVAYGLLNFGIVTRTVYLTKTRVTDAIARRNIYRAMWGGAAIFGLGFALWNVDVHMCHGARTLRHEWGMPYGFLLEGHAWWHIFTSFGIYYFLVSQQYVRCLLMDTKKFYEFRWRGIWPEFHCTDQQGLLRHRLNQKQASLDKKKA